MLVTKSNPAGGRGGGDTREGTSRGGATEWGDRARREGEKEIQEEEVEKEYETKRPEREESETERQRETG